MKRVLKKIASLCLATGMVLSLMIGTVYAENDNEEYTIHYFSARSAEEGTIQALAKVAEMYKEEHPGFNLEIESIADRTAYLQKLRILASSDELPDWFDSDADSFFQSLVDTGQITDIDAVYEELGVADKIYTNAKEYQRLSDGFLGLICWQANTEYFWYNKDVFEAAGITETPNTWDEFFEVCEQLVAAGITPISLAGGDAWPPLRYLAFIPFRERGNDFIEKARVGEESFGSETGLKAANFMVDIAKYFQDGWSTADSATTVGLVTSGSVAMTYDGTWQVPYFVDENKNLKDDIGYFTLPTCGEDDATAPSDFWAHAGIGTAINQNAMDDQMKDFLSFLFEHFADVSLLDYDVLPMMPTTTTEGLSDFYLELMDNYGNVDEYGYCWDVRIDSASNEVLERETVNLALGSITPEEWAARLDEAVEQNVN